MDCKPANLYPLTAHEITLPKFDLDRYLMFGGLPAARQSDEPAEYLDSYVQSYINEEIKGESVVRKIPAFVDFLRAAALSNGQIINFVDTASTLARSFGFNPSWHNPALNSAALSL